MTTYHVACAVSTGPNPGYWDALDTYEIGGGLESPNNRTVNRWRREAPEAGRFVPPVDGGLLAAGFAGEGADTAWAATEAIVERTIAAEVLLRTPPSFRPTQQNRAAIAAFFTGREGPQVAWWAQGLWEPEDQGELCAAMGVLPVVDPLSFEQPEAIPPGDRFYWRLLGGPGFSTRFSDYELDRLLDLVLAREGGTVVFGAPQMFGEARRFAALLREAAPPAADLG